MTSTGFGGWVRRRYSGVAVGHWGTLDPTACGVLVLAIGKATRLLPLITPSDKQYAFELCLGSATDTGDASGQLVERGDAPNDWRERLPEVAAGLVGPLEQVPPMFSAVKIDGRPLYMSARRGVAVARVARATRVRSLRVVSVGERSARMHVACEAGLYVRTLCEELGKRLGVPAHMGALVRVAAGPFGIAASRMPQDIAADPGGSLIDPLRVLTQPQVELDDAAAERFTRGNDVMDAAGFFRPGELERLRRRESGPEVLVVRAGRCLGVGDYAERHGGASIAPTRVLAASGVENGAGGGVAEAKP